MEETYLTCAMFIEFLRAGNRKKNREENRWKWFEIWHRITFRTQLFIETTPMHTFPIALSMKWNMCHSDSARQYFFLTYTPFFISLQLPLINPCNLENDYHVTNEDRKREKATRRREKKRMKYSEMWIMCNR